MSAIKGADKVRFSKNRSRLEIMHYMLSFCTSRSYGADGRLYPGSEGFVFGADGKDVRVGDLVLLESIMPPYFPVGWLHEIDLTHGAGHSARYLVESIDNGKMCWWSNVGIKYFPRDKVSSCWRWVDRQWEFKERWFRVCYKIKGAYIDRPLFPEFGEGFSVSIGLRTSHGIDDIVARRTYPDWRKITIGMLAACFDECVAERNAERDRRKAEKESGDLSDPAPPTILVTIA